MVAKDKETDCTAEKPIAIDKRHYCGKLARCKVDADFVRSFEKYIIYWKEPSSNNTVAYLSRDNTHEEISDARERITATFTYVTKLYDTTDSEYYSGRMQLHYLRLVILRPSTIEYYLYVFNIISFLRKIHFFDVVSLAESRSFVASLEIFFLTSNAKEIIIAKVKFSLTLYVGGFFVGPLT